MIRDIARLVRWEQFKLQRRWMPWILLAILVAFSQIGIWVSFSSFGSSRSFDQSLYDQFTLPGSISNAAGTAQSIGMVLLTVLAASVIGSEYGLGTLRLVLARGTGRRKYLASKFVLLVGSAAAGLLIVVALATVSSLIAGRLAQAPAAASSYTWGKAGTSLLKAWTSLIPTVALTGLVTVLARSTAAGMAVGLGYGFGEQIITAILLPRFHWFQTVANYLIGRNISALAGASGFGPGGIAYPGILHASLVLAAYTVVLGAVAFWLFQRRDVAGASGVEAYCGRAPPFNISYQPGQCSLTQCPIRSSVLGALLS